MRNTLLIFTLLAISGLGVFFIKLYKTNGLKSVLSYTDNAPLLASLSEFEQANPAFSERYLVWQDNRNGNWDIYALDVVTKAEIQVTTNTADQVSPTTSGDTVAWIDYRVNPLGDIYTYTFSTKLEKQITQDLFKQENLSLNGDYVTYENTLNSDIEIYARNLAALKEYRLTTNPAIQKNPSVSYPYVVWEDRRTPGRVDIYLYDFTSGKEAKITSANTINTNPYLNGTTLVWEVNNQKGIWGCTVSGLACTEAAISTSDSGQKNPTTVGSLVVWDDYRNGDWDVYSKNLVTGEELPMAYAVYDQFNASLGKGFVAWEDRRNDHSAIYYRPLTQ